jgi:hypothetical protein
MFALHSSSSSIHWAPEFEHLFVLMPVSIPTSSKEYELVFLVVQ